VLAAKGVRVKRTWAVLLVLGAMPSVHANAYPRPGTTDRASVSSKGAQANAGAGQEAITPDGRFVAFASAASTLAPGDTNGRPDVFVHDRRSGRTELASIAADGKAGVDPNSPSTCGAEHPAISADGRFVAFESCFANLIPGRAAGQAGDTNLAADVFVRDMLKRTTVRVSVADDGSEGSGPSRGATISADGRLVAFQSGSSDLVAAHCPSDPVAAALCPSNVNQIYVRDVLRGTTRLVSLSSAGVTADGSSQDGSISPDGRFVAFTSSGSNLSEADTNRCVDGIPSCPDVFVRDVQTNRTELVSVGLNGRSSANGVSGQVGVAPVQAVSAGGRFVVFRSNARGLVPNDGADAFPVGIFVRDRVTGRTTRASVDSSGQILSIPYASFALSPDGRYVAVNGTRLLPCSPVHPGAVGVHDRLTGATDPVGTANVAGQPDCSTSYAGEGQISAGGRYVAFTSASANLVKGDTNGKADVFVRDRGPDLGVGGLAGSGQLTVSGTSSFRATGLVSTTDLVGDVQDALAKQGADLIGASLAYRPQLGDVFVRLELARMPPVTAAPAAIQYGLSFEVDGRAYQVRATKLGVEPTFELLARTTDGWAHAATLSGGFGTTGQEIVAALPLRDLGLTHGGTIHSAVAYTSLAAGGPQPVDLAVDRLVLAGG
jgi:hypothetical protein